MAEIATVQREEPAPTLAGLPETRRRILVALKKRGEAGVDGLAGDVGITVSAVRQHLAGLSASGFVTHRAVKGGPGRPRHVYRLSGGAEALFPKRYGELTNELLAYVEDEDPTVLERIFERRRRRRVEGAIARLEGMGFAQKVAELARILDEDGYLADFEALPDGTYRITEHNCAVLGVARRWGLACSTEIDFLREALPEASIERVAHMIAGGHVCRYEITPRARAGRRPRGRAGPRPMDSAGSRQE
jgi:DeoR family transcriptional regulator, suf operon transcriptional repressor